MRLLRAIKNGLKVCAIVAAMVLVPVSLMLVVGEIWGEGAAYASLGIIFVLAMIAAAYYHGDE